MAKKSARKEITKINLKQAALEGLSYERACETAKRAGKPSYRFTVGDKVQVGHLLNCVVDEALEGGYMYLIRSGANCDDYSCWAWTSVRPLDNGNSTHFAKRNSALSRLHYSNRSMYSLLSFQYLFGVDFNPDYGKEMQVQYPVSNLITFEMIKNKVISAWAIAPRKLSDEVKEFLAENCADYSKYWSDIPMKTVSRIKSGRKVLWENPYFEGNRK